MKLALTRRQMLPLSMAALAPLRALWAGAGSTVRGRLETGEKPALVMDSRRIALFGDEDTMKVLADERLKDADCEVTGRYENETRFAAAPIDSHALAIYKDGKRWFVTYWCDNCSVRYIVPGPCVCCGKFTALDLRAKIDD